MTDERTPTTEAGRRMRAEFGFKAWTLDEFDAHLEAIDAAVREPLLAEIERLRDALGWTLRNNGGECPANHPEGYVKAMRALLGAPPESVR